MVLTGIRTKIYCSTILPEIPIDNTLVYYKGKNNESCVLYEIIDSMWNYLRASYIQEYKLNNGNENILFQNFDYLNYVHFKIMRFKLYFYNTKII